MTMPSRARVSSTRYLFQGEPPVGLVLPVRPPGAGELLVLPPPGPAAEVGVPADPGPVQFEALDGELGRRQLEERGRPDVLRRVEEPLGRVQVGGHVQPVRPETTAAGAGHQPGPAEPPGLSPQPPPGGPQVPGQDNRVIPHPGQPAPGRGRGPGQHVLHPPGDDLRPERPPGDRQVQGGVGGHPDRPRPVWEERGEPAPGRGPEQPGGDVGRPVGEPVQQGPAPLR
jgi:hypothetical protein